MGGVGWGQDWEEGITKGYKKTFRDNGYIHYLIAVMMIPQVYMYLETYQIIFYVK